MNSKLSYSPETPNLGQIWWFLEPCDLEIWGMTLQNNRAPLLCYFKLCASFRSHWWIQIWVTSGNAQSGSNLTIIELCDLEIWWMTLQDNRAPLLLHALCIISYPSVNSNLSYSPKTPNLGQIQRFLEPWDLEILRMTMKNIRAPLLPYFKLYA